MSATPNGDLAYVMSLGDNVLTGIQANAGQLSSLGTVAQLPGSGVAGVTSPDGKYLFVSVSEPPFSIMSYQIAPGGSLTPAPGAPLSTGTQVYTLAVEPGGQYLYAPSTNGLNYIYEINQNDGSLTAKPPVQRSGGGQVFDMAILEV